MKLLTGGKDISQLIEKITWSGDTSQVSRKINFTIAQNKKDTLFPNVSIDIGDEIIMQDDAENNIFGGIIFDADKKGSSKTVSYLAYDLLFYVNQSDVNMVFFWDTRKYCHTDLPEAGYSLRRTGSDQWSCSEITVFWEKGI